jgi:hypothetical protein
MWPHPRRTAQTRHRNRMPRRHRRFSNSTSNRIPTRLSIRRAPDPWEASQPKHHRRTAPADPRKRRRKKAKSILSATSPRIRRRHPRRLSRHRNRTRRMSMWQMPIRLRPKNREMTRRSHFLTKRPVSVPPARPTNTAARPPKSPQT